MSFTQDDVKHIAHLAKLELNEAEIDKFLPQLSGILEMAKMLDEVDTTHVQPLAQITGIDTHLYKDEPQTFPHAEKLLAQSPQEIKDKMIRVKNIF